MPGVTRVLLIEPNPAVRDALRALLSSEPGCEVVEERASLDGAAPLPGLAWVDAILADAALLQAHASAAAVDPPLLPSDRGPRIVALCLYAPEAGITWRWPVDEWVLKDAPPADLVAAARGCGARP